MEREPEETGPTGEELDRLVRRVGGRVVRATRLWSGRTATEVELPSHRAKVQLLASLAEWDANRPKVIELGRQLAAEAGGDREQIARYIHAWILDHVTFLPEPRELFRSTERTIEDGIGDCDDASRALLALYRAAGLRAGLATLGNPPEHVAVAVKLRRGWLWAEPTVPGAQLGEHPRAAVRRTLQNRPELGDPMDEFEQQQIRLEMLATSIIGVGAFGFGKLIGHPPPKVEDVLIAATVALWGPLLFRVILRKLRQSTES